MDIITAAKRRYSTKSFDSSRALEVEVLEEVKELLQLAPSSTNIQPWHFTIATTQIGKQRIARATSGFFAFNEHKILSASVVVVFSTRIDVNDSYFEKLLECEDRDGRYAEEEFREQADGGRRAFANIHSYELKDMAHWLEKQTYLNVGNFLLGVSALGLDAVPMEGFSATILNSELGLIERGYNSTVVVAVGYRTSDDFNAILPKSRLPQSEIIEVI